MNVGVSRSWVEFLGSCKNACAEGAALEIPMWGSVQVLDSRSDVSSSFQYGSVCYVH